MADRTEASRIETAVEDLGTTGISVCPDILPLDLAASLLVEQRRREDAGEMAEARVGRGSARTLAGGERQARSSWFNDRSTAERRYLAFAESMRLAINRRLMLGLFEFEAQFLLYPPGGFYRRHSDALHGERTRVVSMVAYLNEAWTNDDGGRLAIWAAGEEGEPVREVVPSAGTVVLMLSEEIAHEVRVAHRARRAVAGWFRVNASSAQRFDPLG